MDFNRLRNYVTISTKNISENYDKIADNFAANVKVMSVIKADGYGHTIAACVEALDAKTDWFAVATFEEAESIRKCGSKKPVLILGYVPLEKIIDVVKLKFTLTLISLEYAMEVSHLAEAYDLVVDGHLKVDTGFNRIGIKANNSQEFIAVIRQIYNCNHLKIKGVFTHFASAGSTTESDIEFTKYQYNLFIDACNYIESEFGQIGIKHCCNSRAALLNPEYHLDMVRIGMHLYGLGPEEDIKVLKLKAAMTWHAKIVSIKEILSGETVGYSRKFVAKKKMKIAVIGCGFGDGYFRSLYLSDLPLITVLGVPCRIVGKICMDYMMIDVSSIEGIKEADDAILMGNPEEGYTSASLLGRLTNGTAVEVTCQVTNRVCRVIS